MTAIPEGSSTLTLDCLSTLVIYVWLVTLNNTAWHCTKLYFGTLYCSQTHFTALLYNIHQCTSLHSNWQNCTTLHFTTMQHFTTLHFAKLHCTALPSASLHCSTSLHCTLLSYTSSNFTWLWVWLMGCAGGCAKEIWHIPPYKVKTFHTITSSLWLLLTTTNYWQINNTLECSASQNFVESWK